MKITLKKSTVFGLSREQKKKFLSVQKWFNLVSSLHTSKLYRVKGCSVILLLSARWSFSEFTSHNPLWNKHRKHSYTPPTKRDFSFYFKIWKKTVRFWYLINHKFTFERNKRWEKVLNILCWEFKTSYFSPYLDKKVEIKRKKEKLISKKSIRAKKYKRNLYDIFSLLDQPIIYANVWAMLKYLRHRILFQNKISLDLTIFFLLPECFHFAK